MLKRIEIFYFSVLVFLICLSVYALAEKTSAQPQNVRGSANVAADGYTNSRGSFILWSDGRITSMDGKIVNEASQYSAVSGYKLPARVSGQCIGASQVAAGAFVSSSGTYIVFTDGSVRSPKNSDAKAGLSSCRTLSGRIFAESGSPALSQEVSGYGGKYKRTYLNGGNSGSAVKITFSQPFKNRPLIFVADEKGTMSSEGYISDISASGFTFTYKGNKALIGVSGSLDYIFMASGE